jgi:Rne/Rng family ribonuclease
MSKEICISSTPHETRLAIIEDEQLTEVYYERENEYTLAGSIYKGRVTRVLPGMQSAFVDVGLERDAFLYVTDFLDEQEDSAEFERVPANGGREDRERAGRENKETRSQDAPAQSSSEAPQQNSVEGFEGGTRRWRGRRGRRGRGSREQAGEQSSQNAAGAGPAVLEHAGDPEYTGASEHELSLESAALGLALPGESLSKYGGQAARESTQTAESREARQKPNFTPSKPSTLIEEPLVWTGSGLLPGESLSRYRSAAVEPSHTSPAASAAQTDIPMVEDKISEPAVQPEETLPETRDLVDGPATDLLLGPERRDATSSTSAAPPGDEASEYEPADASASYRVDPSAPSEFRVASPASDNQAASEDEETFPSIPEMERRLPAGQSGFDGAELQNGKRASDEDGGYEQDLDDSTGDTETTSSTGLVEEEEMNEEEEYDFTLLYDAAEEHDLEEMEEETLDRQAAAGAEIDDLVRDEHLDRRIEGDAPGLAIDAAEGSAEVVEIDQDEEDAFAEDEPEPKLAETSAAAVAPGEPARRDRQDHRRHGGRQFGRRRHNGRRQSAQTSDLPVISELLKQGQEILVQIAKEPIAKKGARITSHIALPGRFLVFMPTVNHVGVSRKISSDEERQRLKRILISEKGAGGGGFIVRTAADGASEDDLRADIRFLISLWTEIKQRADEGKAPALIYHDLNLVERILRDQVSDNFSTIWVDSEVEYERIVRFLNRFQPSLVRHVKLYTKETPLFEQFGIQEEIGKALKSKVWLKSGGSIVINQTEALVAIDINTGKYVGKTARLEDTILKTNLDAIPEIVRQIRLRDLGGIIVIDFIDMDERKNRHKVMQALEEALKADRAPSKVLQFNDFGLVAITRKRVKQSLERTLCVQCSTCGGTGMTKSPTTVCNEIYVEMRKMQRHFEGRDVLLRVHPEVVKTLKTNNGRWLNELEEMIGKTIIVKSDPALPPEQFDIH